LEYQFSIFPIILQDRFFFTITRLPANIVLQSSEFFPTRKIFKHAQNHPDRFNASCIRHFFFTFVKM